MDPKTHSTFTIYPGFNNYSRQYIFKIRKSGNPNEASYSYQVIAIIKMIEGMQYRKINWAKVPMTNLIRSAKILIHNSRAAMTTNI